MWSVSQTFSKFAEHTGTKKILRGNRIPFMTKTLRKATKLRSRLKTILIKPDLS